MLAASRTGRGRARVGNGNWNERADGRNVTKNGIFIIAILFYFSRLLLLLSLENDIATMERLCHFASARGRRGGNRKRIKGCHEIARKVMTPTRNVPGTGCARTGTCRANVAHDGCDEHDNGRAECSGSADGGRVQLRKNRNDYTVGQNSANGHLALSPRLRRLLRRCESAGERASHQRRAKTEQKRKIGEKRTRAEEKSGRTHL